MGFSLWRRFGAILFLNFLVFITLRGIWQCRHDVAKYHGVSIGLMDPG